MCDSDFGQIILSSPLVSIQYIYEAVFWKSTIFLPQEIGLEFKDPRVHTGHVCVNLNWDKM